VDERLRAIKYRAHHRGTREADFMIGGFFDAHHAGWGAAEYDWFEALLNEQDVDIMAWAIGTAEAPERFQGPMLDAFRKLDFIRVHK
jgi:antitoxin CptB